MGASITCRALEGVYDTVGTVGLVGEFHAAPTTIEDVRMIAKP